MIIEVFGARNRTRTCTYARTLVPETSASTNSAIRAKLFVKKCSLPTATELTRIFVPRTRLELAHP